MAGGAENYELEAHFYMVAATLANAETRKYLVEINRLSVDFGRQKVLREIDLKIPRGQTLAVIGESGCGKTVLLKAIIGLLRPSAGAVIFDGKDLAKLDERELTRERIRFGFLFQGAALFDSMTIAQNISFPLRQHTKKTAEEMRRIISARLAEVGLPENVLGKKPGELSGGMRKRVGLARRWPWSPRSSFTTNPPRASIRSWAT